MVYHIHRSPNAVRCLLISSGADDFQFIINFDQRNKPCRDAKVISHLALNSSVLLVLWSRLVETLPMEHLDHICS